MSILGNLLKKKEIVISAPVAGQCVSLQEVPDETFSQELLGKGIAIQPTDGKVCAPADGEVSAAFPTGHAIGINTGDGVELLIHLGVDTVKLEGKHFELKVEVGQKVKKGDLLVIADIEGIRADGYDTITPVIVTNTTDYSSVEGTPGKAVVSGDEILLIKR